MALLFGLAFLVNGRQLQGDRVKEIRKKKAALEQLFQNEIRKKLLFLYCFLGC
jgi:hypothetical protein